MRSEAYTCDICGVQKQASNHWLRAEATQVGGFAIFPWEYGRDAAIGTEEFHLCGLGCATKAMLKAMTPEDSHGGGEDRAETR